MKKFIIITTINKPTKAIEKFAKIKDWQLIVVGDLKTPKNWRCKNVIYLSPEDQERLNFNIIKNLPWNHYSRKMIGYLYAIKMGADIIADSDDDNIPLQNWGEDINFNGKFKTIKNNDFVNIYNFFTNKFIWPRGLPLNKITQQKNIEISNKQNKIGVWQYLANEDPDVDAIYRLTNNDKIIFNKKDKVVLDNKTICPFNSQNTFFTKKLFPLLYLPAFVTFRFTDILRGLIAQPIMWSEGYKLGFAEATVVQKRNIHNYMKDFESEIPMYLNGENVINIGYNIFKKNDPNIFKKLEIYYQKLQTNHITTKSEITLLKNWIKDVSSLIK